MANVDVDRALWSGRRVLLTGHTGFKGAWLRKWLDLLGADVAGASLPAETGSFHDAVRDMSRTRDLVADVRDARAIASLTAEFRPEVVLHLAAQAFVRRSYRDPVGTFATNVAGTLHVLEAARAAGSVKAVVVVTSDKVYENDGSGRSFRESGPLGGADPYSASKAATELAVRSWRAAHHGPSEPVVATARAGNVIGGGDIGEDRLVPDAIRAVKSGRPLLLRHPRATRPWQFVLEPLHGYLLLAEALLDPERSTPSAVNFGPADPGIEVGELASRFFRYWGDGCWVIDDQPHPAEATSLRIDPSLAAEALGWQPLLPIDKALSMTVAWHHAQDKGDDLRAVTLSQIDEYTARIAGARTRA